MDDLMELMKKRHSVRQYLKQPIPEDIRNTLNEYAAMLNSQGNLNIQILYDEPECFNSRMAHYGNFADCNNYISMVGKKASDLDERCGYYGEQLVLEAQRLGLNTCWAAMTHGKSKATVGTDEKEVIIIALGYGKTQGESRRSKSLKEVSNVTAQSPAWFKNGVEAALLAPTAVNQQKFRLEQNGEKVRARVSGIGFLTRIDLGIVKYHFEAGSGKENDIWI